MSGNITKRGTNSWRIKFELEKDPATGQRRTALLTVKGTKKQAQAVLTQKLAEVAGGDFVYSSKSTVGDYARHWVETIAPSRTSSKTRERYAEIVEKHIVPQIGKSARRSSTVLG